MYWFNLTETVAHYIAVNAQCLHTINSYWNSLQACRAIIKRMSLVTKIYYYYYYYYYYRQTDRHNYTTLLGTN